MATKKEKRRVPELLAPAGTKEAFIAAVESGADAVYIGGKMLNARMGAGNFDLQEIKEAIDFARKRHVKVYITVNTLVSDEEMEGALAYCHDLYNIGADALIIQDLGLGHLIKKYLPDFPIHLSTQGSVYDASGVEAAKEMGYERVVLAREVSLKEIRDVCSSTDVEIEVFCHGALCICYSGQCQMSRAIGARSGNRGACAQPCRLAYEIRKGTTADKGYFLSPSDINLIDYIGELADAGVASIKIEGRMKSPEYVAVVTSIYRKYIDSYRDNGNYKVSDEDRFALAQIFNRGFTNAYMEGVDDNFMSGEKPKHRGIYVGEVVKSNQIKGKDDRFVIDASLSVYIDKGDVLEIGEGARCKVTLLEGRFPKQTIGDVIGDVKEGDAIYRMVSEKQISQASLVYKNKDWHAGKFERKNKVTWDVIANQEGYLKCILRDASGISVEAVGGPFDLSEDDSAADRIKESLSKMGGTPFKVDKINLRGIIPYKIPVSKINEIRRSAVESMESALCDSGRDIKRFEVEDIFASDSQIGESDTRAVELFYYDQEVFLSDASIEMEAKKICDAGMKLYILLPVAQLISNYDCAIAKAQSIDAEIIPYIDNITKGKENETIEKEFDAICKLALLRGIYVGNINWIRRFSDAGIKVYGDYGINKYNRWTEEAIKEFGSEFVANSLESFDIGSGMWGRAPLMTSEHSFPGEYLIDRKGEEYVIVKRLFSDQDIIAVGSTKNVYECVLEQCKSAPKSSRRIRVYI